MEEKPQTLVCTKYNDNLFKLTIFDGYNYTYIYKDREYIESLIKYLRNTIDGRYRTIDIDNLNEEDRKKYCEI